VMLETAPLIGALKGLVVPVLVEKLTSLL
jgi:hypothetical protein